MGLGCFFDLGGEVFSSGAFLFFGVKSTTTPRGDPPEELGRFKAFFDFGPGSSGGSSGWGVVCVGGGWWWVVWGGVMCVCVW